MKKITFSYVVDDFFQSDQFLPIYSSGKFVEQIFCDSYFGEHLTCRAAISCNAYHDAITMTLSQPVVTSCLLEKQNFIIKAPSEKLSEK